MNNFFVQNSNESASENSPAHLTNVPHHLVQSNKSYFDHSKSSWAFTDAIADLLLEQEIGFIFPPNRN